MINVFGLGWYYGIFSGWEQFDFTWMVKPVFMVGLWLIFGNNLLKWIYGKLESV